VADLIRAIAEIGQDGLNTRDYHYEALVTLRQEAAGDNVRAD
jgi:hypothetical protein